MGGFKVVYEYANNLVARGHKVCVVHGLFLTESNLFVPSELYRYLRRKILFLRDVKLPLKIRWQWIDQRVQMVYISKPTTQNMPDADAIFATGWQTVEDILKFPPSKGQKYYLIQSYETWGGAGRTSKCYLA